MRLMDQIVQAQAAAQAPLLQQMSGRVGEANVRYVLSDDVAAICDRLVADHFDMLADMIELVRIGEESMWIERRSSQADQSGVHRRIGLLVEADHDGRAGTITIAIEVPGQPPLVMPQGIFFDFDGGVSQGCDGISQFGITDFATKSTCKLANCFAIRVAPSWREYYALDSRPPAVRKEIMDEMASSAMPDGLFLTAFAALIMSRRSFREAPSQLERLNRNRTKSGKPALLEHVEVKAHLIANDVGHGGHGHGERRPARLHHVRGHFVRRGTLLFWRSAHFRGDPERIAACRTVHLTL